MISCYTVSYLGSSIISVTNCRILIHCCTINQNDSSKRSGFSKNTAILFLEAFRPRTALGSFKTPKQSIAFTFRFTGILIFDTCYNVINMVWRAFEFFTHNLARTSFWACIKLCQKSSTHILDFCVFMQISMDTSSWNKKYRYKFYHTSHDNPKWSIIANYRCFLYSQQWATFMKFITVAPRSKMKLFKSDVNCCFTWCFINKSRIHSSAFVPYKISQYIITRNFLRFKSMFWH